MTAVKRKIVVGLSGGMDSTTLLAYLLANDFDVLACTFMYGSKHNQYEQRAVFDIIQHYQDKGYPVEQYTVDLTAVGLLLKSNLLKSGGDIPEGHYEAESMRATVVPGRNLIFASVMAGIAESHKADYICLGVHSGDHHIYPDCRPKFIASLANTVLASTDNAVDVMSPFLSMDKTKILMYGYRLATDHLENLLDVDLMPPYELTRTCYKDQKLSCGKCGSCQERLEAYKNVDLNDPIKYE